jgi:hypothetical protein
MMKSTDIVEPGTYIDISFCVQVVNIPDSDARRARAGPPRREVVFTSLRQLLMVAKDSYEL